MAQTKFSVIIPVGRAGTEKKIEAAVRKNDFCQEEIEIIFVYGQELPGEKRNNGVALSKGEYLVFIDDDVELRTDYFSTLAKILVQESADVVGGPNCSPESGNEVQRMIDIAFKSRLGFGKGAERFRSNGSIIPGNEDILTACNLCIKRSAFLNVGGFEKKRFPGEEVELVRRLRIQKYHLLYHPALVVLHHRRTSLKALWAQLFHYGRGRADLIAEKGFQLRDITYLAPVCMIVFFVLSFPFKVGTFHPCSIGVLAYLVLLLANCLKQGVSNNLNMKEMITLFAVFATIHFSYGVGMLSRIKFKRQVNAQCE